MERTLLFGERMLLGDGQTAFNVAIPVRLCGTFTEAGLHYALRRLQQKHPWLNAFIRNNQKGRPRFVVNETHFAKIPLRIVERNSGDDWQTEVLTELSTAFNTAQEPLIRLVWINGAAVSEIILVVHHCLCDGSGAMVILGELLQVLDDCNSVIGKEEPITSLADVIPSNILNSKGNKIKAALIGGIATLALWLIPVKKKTANRGDDYFIHWKLDEHLSSLLIHLCKAGGVTVNTLLCGVVLNAFKEIRQEKAHNKISCPVDIRRFAAQIEKDQIFAYGLMFVISADPGLDFLSNAKAMQDEIAQKTAKLDPYFTIMIMEAAHASLNRFTNFLKYGKSTNDCMFSNLGKIDIPYRYRSFEVETIYSPSVIGPLGNTTTLLTSTYRGQMDFSFIASEGFIPHDEALLIKDKIISIIQEVTEELKPEITTA